MATTAHDAHGLPALLTVRETARMLNCSVDTVRQMIEDGSLEPIRLRQVAGAQLRGRASDVRRIIEPEWSRSRQA